VDSFDFKEMLDKTQYPSGGDLSGSIGLGSREAPLNERASLDGQCGCLALEHGRSMREEARKRALANGLGDAATLQCHGNLLNQAPDRQAGPDLASRHPRSSQGPDRALGRPAPLR